MSNLTPSGSGGLVGTVSIESGKQGFNQNVSMPLANTEYQFSIPIGAKLFFMFLRDNPTYYYVYYTSGEAEPLRTKIPKGVSYELENISPDAARTIYFQSPLAGQIMQIVYWV